MDRDTVGLLLASTLAGLAALLAVVALARQPFLLFAAVPFAVGAYLVWRGATGQFGFGLTSGQRIREARFREASRQESTRASRGSRNESRRVAGRRGPRQQRRQRRGFRGPPEQSSQTLERAEAYRVLGLSPDADAAAVKAAYREQVKRTHPDADGGDREAFQRVNAAYETLREEA